MVPPWFTTSVPEPVAATWIEAIDEISLDLSILKYSNIEKQFDYGGPTAGQLQRGRHCYTILLSENAI